MFSRRRGETEAPPFDAENTSNEQQNEATRERGFGTTFYFNSYQHGFTNGVLQVKPDEDSFFRFLKHDREVERLEEQRRMKVQELEKLETELALKKPIELEKKLLIASHRVQEENLNAQIKKLEEDEARHRNTLAALRERREEIKPEYSWVPAMFFLIAGLVFVAADITITHNITSNGFDMDEKEGWVFAIGLAFTAFLVKPFLDRVFEKPFQKSGHVLKRWYKLFLIFIVFASISMLYVLGEFRSEAQGTLLEVSRNDDLIGGGGGQNAPAVDTDALEARNASLLKTLSESKFGKAGLILSGIIFAIGGGICLSVAFPSLNDLMLRHHFFPRRMRRQRRFIRRVQQKIKQTKNTLTEDLQRLNTSATELELLSMKELTAEIRSLRSKIEEVSDQIFGERALRDQMLYLDGKERGSKYFLDGDLKYSMQRTANSLETRDNSQDDGHYPEKRKYNRRPYVKLRKLLTDLYNKSKNGIFYEESGVDIPA